VRQLVIKVLRSNVFSITELKDFNINKEFIWKLVHFRIKI